MNDNKNRRLKNSIIISALIFFCLGCNLSFAVSSTETSETKLVSDSAVCKRQEKNITVCTYFNNANFTQKDTDLKADQITVYRVGEKINKIVARGKKSFYNGVSNENNQPIHASAEVITIYPDKNLMILEGDGQILTGEDRYGGPYIKYNFK